jgi:golgin subfamily B member 1
MSTSSDESGNLAQASSEQAINGAGIVLPHEAIASLHHDGWLGLVTDCPAIDAPDRRHGMADFLEAVLAAIGDRTEASVEDFRRAISHFGGLARESLRAQQPHPSLGIELIRLLHVLVTVAEEIDDLELWQRGLEWQVCARVTGTPRAQAYGVLADFLAERAGDSQAAGRTWILAAREAGLNAKDRRVSLGYWERAFAILGDDRDVAESLVTAYADVGDWNAALAPFGALVRKSEQSSDVEHCIGLLLALRGPAVEQRASQQYGSLVDEVRWSVSADSAVLGRALMLAKAQVYSADPDRADAAVDAYFAALESHSQEEDQAELYAFIRRHPNPGWRREQLARLYEWRIARAPDLAPVIFEWARSEETEFENPGGAAALFERLVSQDPANQAALREIRRLRQMMNDWDGVELALGRLGELVSEPKRSEIDLERAEILVGRMSCHEAALELVVSAMGRHGDPARVYTLLTSFLQLDNSELRLTAAEQLVELTKESATDRLPTLRSVLTATRDLANDGTGRGSLRSSALRRQWFELAVSSWTTVDDEGFALASEAVVEFPDSDSLWDALGPWSNHATRAHDIVQLFQRAIERTGDRELVDQLGQKMAAFAESANVDVDVVLAALMKVVRFSPGARWALDRVKLHLGAQGRWNDLLELYDGAMEEARANNDGAAEMHLLTEASVTAKDLASDPERAIRYFERILELDPRDARTDAALERLYERYGHTERLVAHLAKRSDGLTGAELRALDERIASLWIDSDHADSALEVVRNGLERSGEWPAAARLLERIFELPSARVTTGTEDTSTAEMASQLLVGIHRATGRHAELTRLLRETLPIVPNSHRRLLLLTDLAETLETSLNDDAAALEVVGELLKLDPTDQRHRVRLGRLAGRLGAADEHTRLLLEAADATADVNAKVHLLVDAAQVTRDQLNDAARAIELYGQIVELGVDLPDIVLEALRALDPLLAALNHVEERCNVLECLAESADDVGLRQYALRAAAQLASHTLGDVDRAATNWRALLDEIPNDAEALEGFIAALEAQGRWPDLAQTLLYRINIGGTRSEARQDRKRLAVLYAERLDEPNAAISEWEGLLAEDPTDYESRDAMAAVLGRLERWPELANHLVAQLPHAHQPEDLHRRLAAVHRDHTNDLRAATQSLLAAGDRLEAWELLTTGAAAGLEDAPLRLEVAASLREHDQGQQAVELLAVQIRLYGDRKPKERSVVHLELARALVAIGERETALAELDGAVAIDPTNPAILAMHGQLALELGVLAAAEKSYRALLLLAMHAATTSSQLPALSVMYFRLAQIAERCNDRDRADELIASSFDAALTSEQQTRELEQALIEARADDLLLRTLDNQLERAEDPEKAAEVLIDFASRRFRLGEPSPILLSRLRDRTDQLSSTLSGIADSEMVLRAHRPLVELYGLLGDTECVLALLMTWSGRFGSSAAGVELQVEAAKLMLGLSDRRMEGIEALLAVWNRDPSRDDVAEVLAVALETEKRYDDLSGLLRDRINRAERARKTEQANSLRLKLGQLLERVGQLDDAAVAYESIATATTEQRREALESLARVLGVLDQYGERLRHVLERLLEISDGRKAAEFAYQLASIFEQLGDRSSFERALGHGFAQDPTYQPLRGSLVAMYRKEGQLAKARETLEYSIECSPRDLGLAVELVDLCESLGDTEGALAVLERALAQVPEDAELNRRRWQLLIVAGRHVEALEALEREHARGVVSSLEMAHAIKDSGLGEDSRSYRLREIELLIAAQAEPEARARLTDWTRTHADDAEAYRQQAKLAVSAKAWQEAAGALARLVDLAPPEGAVAAALDLAIACERLGDSARAIPALERARSFVPDHEELELQLLKSYEDAGLHDRIGALFLERSQRPAAEAERVDLLERAADHFFEANSPSQALAALERADALDPERLSIALSRVKALRLLDARVRALEVLNQHLVSSRHARDRDRYRLFEALATLHLEQDELHEAFEALSQAHKLERAHPRIALLLGLVASDLDDVATASNVLRAAVAAAKTNDDRWALSASERASAYAELSRLQLTRGSQTTARQMLDKAIEEDPNHHLVVALTQAMQRH